MAKGLVDFVTMEKTSIVSLAQAIAARTGSGPATPEALRALRECLPVWDAVLDDLFGVCDGSVCRDVIPPGDFLLSTAQVATSWERRIGTYTSLFDEATIHEVDQTPAGTHLGVWSHYLVPLSDDGAGNCWALDLREGQRRGCVLRWWNDSGGHLPGAPSHASLAALLGQATVVT